MKEVIERLMEDERACPLCRGLLQGMELRSLTEYVRSEEEKRFQRTRAVCFEGHLERMHGWKREDELEA